MRPVQWGAAVTLLSFATAAASLLALSGTGRLAAASATGAAILLAIPISLVYEAKAWWRKRGWSSGRPGRQPGPQSYRTVGGDVVKSRGEAMIADYLSFHRVDYRYEQPALTRYRRRPFAKPDFYLPDHDVFIEYWGLLDHPDPRTRKNYEKNMRWKMAQYHRNGLKFVSLYPSDLADLDLSLRRKVREATGRDLLIR